MADASPAQILEQKEPSILNRTWRYLPFKKYDPIQLVALSDVALSSVHKSGTPMIWLFGVTSNTISLGANQNAKDVINLQQARRLKIDLIRRTSGGGAQYLDTAGEISWAAVMPNELLPQDPQQILLMYADKIASALGHLGIECDFHPPNDIYTTLGKVSVMTIKRERYATMISGTLLYAVNTAIMQSVLTPENDPNKSRKIPERLRPITSVSMEAECSKEDTIKEVSEALLDKQTFKIDDWSSTELSDAQILVDKYSSKEWLKLD